MNMIHRTCCVVLGLGAVASIQSSLAAQSPSDQPSQMDQSTEPAASPLGEAESSPFDFTVAAGYIYQFDSEPDNADSFTVGHLSAGAGMNWRLSPDASLMFRINYGFDNYDFGDGADPFGGVPGQSPWGDISTIEFGAILNYSVSDDFSLFGGPILGFAGETDADWGDSFIGGGVAGGSYAFSKNLRLGGGVGVISQIEDDVKVILVPVVEWKLSDNWRISTGNTSNSSDLGVALTGIELIWTLSDKWQLSLGGAYSYSRFRLNDDGPAPDGVGEDESWPLWLRAVWNVTDRVQLEGIGGLMLGGEISLSTSAGSVVESSDYDGGYFLGVMGSVRF